MTELSLILPVQNEAEIIETVFSKIVKQVRKVVKNCEFILVENGSTDSSLGVIKKLSKKYQDTKYSITLKGYGAAILKGLSLAKGKYLCYMPSDGQIDLTVFEKLWQNAKLGEWELVKVKRINRESFSRTFISIFFSLTLSLLFGTAQIDVNGSPRIFERKYLSKLNLKSKDSFIDAEFLIKAARLGWKIKEIQMRTQPRLGGKSTRSAKTYFEFIVNILRFKLGKSLSDWEKTLSSQSNLFDKK